MHGGSGAPAGDDRRRARGLADLPSPGSTWTQTPSSRRTASSRSSTSGSASTARPRSSRRTLALLDSGDLDDGADHGNGRVRCRRRLRAARHIADRREDPDRPQRLIRRLAASSVRVVAVELGVLFQGRSSSRSSHRPRCAPRVRREPPTPDLSPRSREEVHSRVTGPRALALARRALPTASGLSPGDGEELSFPVTRPAGSSSAALQHLPRAGWVSALCRWSLRLPRQGSSQGSPPRAGTRRRGGGRRRQARTRRSRGRPTPPKSAVS